VRSRNQTGSLNDNLDSSSFENGAVRRVRITNGDSDAGEDTELSNASDSSKFGDTTVIVTRIKRKEERVGGSFSIESETEGQYEAVAPESYRNVRTQKIKGNELEASATGSRFAIPKESENDIRGPAAAEDVDFSFLGMIKWIIIIGVLIFIGVFAASQLNSIRKGWTD